jgi:hypothetical protein
MAYGLIKDIKGFHIHVRNSYKSPTKLSYAGYTVSPGIHPPPRKLIPHLAVPS